VFVRINDRGPYIEGRSLDLSKGSAKALGILRRGVVNVKVEEVIVPAQNTQIVSLD
jgi:rare lipoprotein A